MRNARVIEKKDVAKDVRLGRLEGAGCRDIDAKQTFEYRIVGSAEANPAENKLSNESPVGKAIIGKKKGETVEVSAPARRDEVQDPRDQSGLVAEEVRRAARAMTTFFGD